MLLIAISSFAGAQSTSVNVSQPAGTQSTNITVSQSAGNQSTSTTVSQPAGAQSTSVTTPQAAHEVVYIKSVRFANALIEKWIAEYAKERPGVLLSMVGKESSESSKASKASAAGETGDQTIEVAPFGKRQNQALQQVPTTAVSFGKYAILPIAGKDNLLIQEELKKKRLNEKRLKELYFEKDVETDEPNQKEKYDVTVYSANHFSSVSSSFAGYFGYEAYHLKGKKIAGDDIYLNSAVKKDAKGISFNNLSYIFDIESRRLNDGIALLPLDVKNEYAEVLNEQNLDEIITLLEHKNIELIPVEELVFVLPEKMNPAALQFLEWALSKGQEYIHSYGFLLLDAKTLSQQRKQLSALENKLFANN